MGSGSPDGERCQISISSEAQRLTPIYRYVNERSRSVSTLSHPALRSRAPLPRPPWHVTCPSAGSRSKLPRRGEDSLERSARSVILALTISVTAAACTHGMHVKNLNAYAKSATAPQPLTIVLEDRSSDGEEREYFTYVHEALAVHPSVRAVHVSPRVPEDVVPDLVVGVRPHADYHGSWWNYFITFPGFLLFTHAWNGFVYRADLVTEVEVREPSRQPAQVSSIETSYNLRHCDFERGAWTSSGWYTPGYGGLNLLIGFFMVPYDEDSTSEFSKEVRTAYGRYIANSIVELANGHGQPPANAGAPGQLLRAAREVPGLGGLVSLQDDAPAACPRTEQ